MAAASKTCIVWTGCYTQELDFVAGHGDGLVPIEVDFKTGELSHPAGGQTEPLQPNPTYLAKTDNGVVAVVETYGERPKDDGCIQAYKFGENKAQLVKLISVTAKGLACCHIVLPRDNRHILAANYASGSAIAYARNADGTLGECTAFMQYEGGTMTNPVRQEAAHAHMCLFDPSEKFVYVPDLGGDVVRGYTFKHDTGATIPSANLELEMPPGSGPRHMAFHPTLPVAYVLNELLSTLATCSFDPETGKLAILSTQSTLPEGADGSNSTTAAIRVLADGSALYASNRGHDSIARFVLAEDGSPTFAECTPAGGKTPRDFLVVTDDAGAQTILLAAAQDSDVISSFLIGEKGALSPTGSTIAVKSPSVLCQV